MSLYIKNRNEVSSLYINVEGAKKSVKSVWVNKDGSPTKVFQLNKGPKIVSWADATKDELISLLYQHYNGEINLADHWHVGDERIVHLSEMANWNTTYGESQPSQDAILIIIGFNVDILRDPINGINKAAMTVQLKNCLTNTGVIDADYITYESKYKSCTLEWVACDRRTWCNNTFKNSLPSELQNVIKIVKKSNYSVYFSGNPNSGEFTKGDDNFKSPDSVYDSCFLLSSSEVGLVSDSYFNDPSYPYFTDRYSRMKNGGRWWIRDPGYSTQISTYLSWNDITTGVKGGQFISNKGGIAPAFCL